MQLYWVPGAFNEMPRCDSLRCRRSLKSKCTSVIKSHTNCRVENLELSRKYKQTSSSTSTLRYTFRLFAFNSFQPGLFSNIFHTKSRGTIPFGVKWIPSSSSSWRSGRSSSSPFRIVSVCFTSRNADPPRFQTAKLDRPRLGSVEYQVETSHEYTLFCKQASDTLALQFCWLFILPRWRRGRNHQYN